MIHTTLSRMGSCFGHCGSSSSIGSGTKCDSLEDMQQKNLIENQSPTASENGGNGNGDINFIYRIIRRSKRRRHDRPQSRSTFLERFWTIRDMRYTRLNPKPSNSTRTKGSDNMKSSNSTSQPQMHSDRCHRTDVRDIGSDLDNIPLQCLDAHLLLSATERRNRPARLSPNQSASSSSLDLEWEHEAGGSQRVTWIGTADDSEEATTASSASSSASSSSSSSSARGQVRRPTQRRRLSMRNAAIAKAPTTEIIPATIPTAPATAAETSTTAAASAAVPANLSRTSSWSHRSTPDSLEWDVDDARPGAATSMHHRFAGVRSSEEDLLDTDTMELLQEIEWLKNQALSETGATFREPSVLLEAES